MPKTTRKQKMELARRLRAAALSMNHPESASGMPKSRSSRTAPGGPGSPSSPELERQERELNSKKVA